MMLPHICIRRPVLAVMMNLALVLFGAIALSRLPVRELPNIDPPIVNISTIYPGADAAVMESEVTERLEESINSIEGIRTLTSESREQVSTITVEFDLSRDIEVAAQDVRDRVARVRGQLPDDIEEPVIAKQEADANPVLWIALYSDRFSTLELTTIAEDYMVDSLQTVKGVSSIYVGGRKKYATRLRLDPARMAAHGITVLDVEAALRNQNVELPSGRIENADREMTIQTRGELKTIDEFNRLVIKEENGAQVRLYDIGRAEIGVEDERSIARFKSKPSIGLGVVKQSTANTIEVAKAIKAELELLKPVLPEGINIDTPYDESVYVDKSISEVWATLGIAFLLVVMTIFIFLRNLRSTLIPSVAVPVSIISTFVILAIMGYSVNTLTMLALILAIGIVVDDAIVVLENIYRHIEEGQSPMDAAHKGMEEITFAVIATTVALAAVFIPLAFQTTVTGRLFVEFAIALCGSVVISSFVALTLTPMMAARVLRPISEVKHGHVYQSFERVFRRIENAYSRNLVKALDHRRIVIAIALVTLGAAVWFYRHLDKEFLPEEDKGRLLCFAITPEGSTCEYTDRMVSKMENIVRSVPEVDGYFSVTAMSREGPGKGNQGLMFIRFKEERDRSVQDIVAGPHGVGARFFGEIEGAIAIPIIPKAVSRGFGQPFQLVIQAQELVGLNQYADELANRLRGAGFLINVRSSFEMNKPELRIHVDRNRAADLGVSIDALSRTLQILFGGQKVSQTKRDGKQYDVLAQLDRVNRMTPSDLDNLYVRNNRGNLIQLSNVVTSEVGGGPNAITHYNRIRSAIIEATPNGVSMGEAVTRVEEILKETQPVGFRHDWSGETRDLKEAGGGFVFVMILALVIVYMILASQFESLVHPFTVMLTIPLAAVGAFGGLWLLSCVNKLGSGLYGWAHYAPDPPAIAGWLSSIVPRIPAMGINLFSQIGIVLLVGLVTKNSILLVDFANQQMAKGKNARDAMLEAGALRLRPILMTAVSTILGILPLAIGFGAGAESRRPMGVAALCGMLTSTFLTLFVIPVVYTAFSEFGSRGKKQMHKTTAVILLLALLPVCASSLADEDASSAYDLDRCLQTALEHNYDILKAEEQVRLENGAQTIARARILPSISVEGTISQTDKKYLQTFGNFGPNDQNWATRIELLQPIHSGGAVAGLRRQNHDTEAAMINLQTTISDTMFQVRQRYYAVLLSDAQVKVEEQNIELLQGELNSSSNRFDAGTVSHFNVLRSEVALANAKTPLIRARNARRIMLHELGRVMGLTVGDGVSGTNDIEVLGQLVFYPVDINLSDAQASARNSRPEIKHHEQILDARKENVREESAQSRPGLFLYGNYGAYNDRFSNDLGDELSGWEAGLRLRWDIFDAGMTKGKVQQARSRLRLAELELEQLYLDIDVEVRRAHSIFVEAVELVAATRKVVEQAEESVRLAAARAESGAATQLDLLDSQVALTQARTNEILALHDFNVAIARLRRTMGVAESYDKVLETGSE